MTGAAPAREGVWTARDPQIADEFARMATEGSRGNAQIYPLVHRTQKPAELRLAGDEKNHEIAATLANAWDRGYDAVMLRNYTSPSGRSGDILVVKDPAQLRSQFAAFDPQKKDSSNLLAGLAGLSGGISLLPGQKRSDQR